MAQKDSGDDGKSLEMPSFGFGRKRKRAGQAAEQEPAPQAAPSRSRVEAPTLDVPPTTAAPEPATAETDPDTEPRPRRRLARPALGGMPASLVTGLVAGLLLVGLTWLSTQFCDLVRGTSSCGDPGFFLLLVVVVVVVLAGRVMLAWFDVPEPGSTSFLAVGLVAVASLLFLSSVLLEAWAAPIVVALTVAGFALSHWVTTAFVDTGGSDQHR
jgi:hypothetical protein